MSENTEQNLLDSPLDQKKPPLMQSESQGAIISRQNDQSNFESAEGINVNEDPSEEDALLPQGDHNIIVRTEDYIESDLLGESQPMNPREVPIQINELNMNDLAGTDLLDSKETNALTNMVFELEVPPTDNGNVSSEPQKDITEDPDRIQFMDDPYRKQLERTMDILQYEIIKRQKLEAVDNFYQSENQRYEKRKETSRTIHN